jgi:hypothetical protein
MVQLAGNQPSFDYPFAGVIAFFALGSPETLCKVVLNSVILRPRVVHRKPDKINEFGSYLAGLFEGDGHLSTQHQVVITMNDQNEKLLCYLRNRVGYGHVRKISGKNAYNWIISDKTGLSVFLAYIDGHLKTQDKLDQIHSRGIQFCQVNPNNTNVLSSWWFAGYAEAEGCFYQRVLQKRREVRISLKFGVKNRDVLDLIKHGFNGSKVFLQRSNNTFYWDSSNFSSATNIVRYFDQHSLLGEKWVKYLKWREIYSIILNKDHRTIVGFSKICKIKSNWSD